MKNMVIRPGDGRREQMPCVRDRAGHFRVEEKLRESVAAPLDA